MSLDSILVEAEPQILDEALSALQRTHLAHYEAAGEVFTRQRLEELYDLVVTAIRDRNLAPVIASSREVAVERFEEGFGISEVQSAFNALEEATWRHVVAVVPPEDLAESIGMLSTVLGAGKDALSREYVSQASRRHVPSLDLSALFGGAGS